MKKKIFFTLIILILLISAGIIYLNNVILPTKIKILIINSLQERTQKKVSLESLQFSIFRGLVLRNLVIYDDKRPIVTLKEGSCTFLIWPFFKKMIVIPNARLRYPEIFLERKKDGTFNLQDLFSDKTSQPQAAKLRIFIYKVTITNANIHFQDSSLAQPFARDIENLNINLSLSLPGSVKFSLSSQVPANPPLRINAAGELRIAEKRLAAKISLQDFSPKEFSAYYQNSGFNIGAGLIDCLINLELKDSVLSARLSSQNKNLNISQEKLSALLNADLRAELSYNLKNRQIVVKGKATIADSEISGLEVFDGIKNISGEVAFSNSGLSSDKLSANIWGAPINAKISLNDFTNPLLNVNIASSLSLSSLQSILKDKFKFVLPGDIKGEGNLSLAIQSKIPSIGPPNINGYLALSNAGLHLKEISSPVEEINGRVEFSQEQLKWPALNFKYRGLTYKTAGVLTNFRSPQVQLGLSSQELSLESNFAIKNKLVSLAKCKGRYLNSEFSLTGDINTENPPNLNTDLKGELNINLEDIKELFKKFSAKGGSAYGGKTLLEQIKPEGLLHTQFNLNGNINDIKSCSITAELSAPSISAYALKAKELSLNYTQASGIIDIALMHLSLYDGTMEGAASMNLNSANLPYWVTADIQGVRLEKLKLDTAAREKALAGNIKAQFKLNGFSNDLSRLAGAGNIFISEGNLWQINLFKGLGALLFARDFANIIFSECSCGFSISDRYIFSDNLQLKSNIADLSGSAKIGFDSSINASLNVKILDEFAPVSGSFKDITTAIIGQSGRFGVIKISGTLKEPKYKFQAAAADIIKGLKDFILGK